MSYIKNQPATTVAPIVPAFYAKPRSVDDIINHTVGRLLDQFGIETMVVRRWQDTTAKSAKR